MGCDLAPLQYLRRWKSLNQMTNTSGAPDYGGSGGLPTVKSVSMFTNLMAQSSKFVMEGVKNLVVKRHNLTVTKIVDELMEVSIYSQKVYLKMRYFGIVLSMYISHDIFRQCEYYFTCR
jgi:hypothetical protein